MSFQVWQEFKESLDTFRVFVIIDFFVLLGLLWIILPRPDLTTEQLLPANLFLWLSVISFFIILIEYLLDKNKVVDAGVLGKPVNFIISVIVGTVLSFLLFTISNSFGVQSLIGVPQSISSSEYLNFFYKVIASGWIETKFFTMFLAPTFASFSKALLQNDLPGIMLSSVAAGIFHFIAYGGNVFLMLGSVIFFTLIFFIGTLTKSFGGALSAHIVFNSLIVGSA